MNINDMVEAPDKVTYSRAFGKHKFRITFGDKVYKLILDDETFDALETKPGQVIHELTLKDPDLDRGAPLWGVAIDSDEVHIVKNDELLNQFNDDKTDEYVRHLLKKSDDTDGD